MSVLYVLDASGDIQVTWNAADAESVARARTEVETLRQAGYSFFLVDGTPADAVAAGMATGTLNCRRVDAEELIPAADVEEAFEQMQEGEAVGQQKRGRGRPRKETVAVATKPLRGG